MKKIFVLSGLMILMSCNGNEKADTTPTELDHTINKDTSATRIHTVPTPKPDSLDSVHKNAAK